MVSIQEVEGGVKVTLLPLLELNDPTAAFPTKLIPDKQISTDCGLHYLRCQPITLATFPKNTSTSNSNSESLELVTILLVPLQDGLLLLETYPDSNENMQNFGSFHILATTVCSPTTVFKIYDSFYTMCTDLEHQYISLYEVRLNGTQIQQSQLIGPLTSLSADTLNFFTASTVMNMSNFLLSTEVPHQPLIYFAIDNYLFTVDPLDWSIYDEFSPIGIRCRQVSRLVSTSNSQLLAYCIKGYAYYDTEYQNWVSEHSYESSGVPYLCPDRSYGITVHNDYLEYRIGTTTGTVSDVDFDNGLCLNGSADNSLFSYIDKSADSLHVFNLTSTNDVRILPALMSVCSDTDCIPLVLLGNKYLIVQQAGGDGTIHVLDTGNGFRSVITRDHQSSSLVTIIQGKRLSLPVVPPKDDQKNRQSVVIIIICVLISIAAIVVSVVIVAVVLFLINKCKGSRVTADLPQQCERRKLIMTILNS